MTQLAPGLALQRSVILATALLACGCTGVNQTGGQNTKVDDPKQESSRSLVPAASPGQQSPMNTHSAEQTTAPDPARATDALQVDQDTVDSNQSTDLAVPKPSRAAIEALVDQLVYVDETQGKNPVVEPNSEEHARRFKVCQDAFAKLTELKDDAFDVLVEHLDDPRSSIPFRNHVARHSVGAACYHIIYFQLQDRPVGYSKYGWSRIGSDGKSYPKPYWAGNPFEEAGGLEAWLTANDSLTYTQMQIKCLGWLLDREKEIGAADAESYFVNILPLEVRILERRLEAGDAVEVELRKMREILSRRDPTAE